ncbi:hypothetical protein [Microtetraspora fusca]|uniref:hypothetical protein n=1 Tax=Microtetraspora fusca TaxID=1997 RepID=UPI0012F9CBE8|nr:hypothetical protein [Microtetraspora fusca]
MPERSTMASALLCLGVLVVLGGCGGAAESSQPTPNAAAKDKRHRLEAVKADCMKQKGFKYVAYVPPERPESDEELKRASGDYQAMRKYSAKYGFGVFAEFAYPEERKRQAGEGKEAEKDPNFAIQGKLSEAQAGAYRKASDACVKVAAKQVLGKDVKSDTDFYDAINKALERARTATLDSDPKLVELAAGMAACLRGKGYPIGTTTPSAMSGRGFKVFLDQSDSLSRKQRDDVPDVAPPVKDGEARMVYPPQLSVAEARPYLDKEIKAALDDLECGKDFYPVYSPKEKAVAQQVNDEFGM